MLAFLRDHWLIVLGTYGIMSLATFCIYAMDKSRANRGRRRITESTMHTLELLGGWPGGLLGQQICRHKTRKAFYQLVFWAIAILHAVVWWLVLT
jgi:uncharacterized membrane protein YsdA (DUF1294 family)